jgi:hypothetical protein
MEGGMSKQFKAGDVAVLRIDAASTPPQERKLLAYDKEDVTVIGGLGWRESWSGPLYCYEVTAMDGAVFFAEPHELFPKRPPRRDIDEVVRWESVGWMPMDVKLDRAIKESLRNQVRERA